MGEDPHASYRFVIYVILDPIISIIGIIGNILCLSTIWYRFYATAHSKNDQTKSMSGRMYAYFCGLAFSDLGYLIFNLQACYLGSSEKFASEYYQSYKRIQMPTWNALKATSDFIVICMTIDRCRMLTNIVEERIGTMRRQSNKPHYLYVSIEMLAILAFCFILHLPQYFLVGDLNGSGNSTENGTIGINGVTVTPEADKPARPSSLMVIYNIIYLACAKIMPIVLVVTLNCLLVTKLKIVWERRKKVKDSESVHQRRRRLWSASNSMSINEQKLALLLVVIAAAFVIFTLPSNVAFIWYATALHSHGSSIMESSVPVFIITNFLESINYSINFYMYCVVHKEIRNSFLDMCKFLFSKLTNREFSSSLSSIGEGEGTSRANGGTMSTISNAQHC